MSEVRTDNPMKVFLLAVAALVASVALVPYLIWVATATTLQLSITWMNR